MFEKFTQARRNGIKGGPSLRLGMSTIKNIVEWHKVHIWFESQENKGTTFYLTLPFALLVPDLMINLIGVQKRKP